MSGSKAVKPCILTPRQAEGFVTRDPYYSARAHIECPALPPPGDAKFSEIKAKFEHITRSGAPAHAYVWRGGSTDPEPVSSKSPLTVPCKTTENPDNCEALAHMNKPGGLAAYTAELEQKYPTPRSAPSCNTNKESRELVDAFKHYWKTRFNVNTHSKIETEARHFWEQSIFTPFPQLDARDLILIYACKVISEFVYAVVKAEHIDDTHMTEWLCNQKKFDCNIISTQAIDFLTAIGLPIEGRVEKVSPSQHATLRINLKPVGQKELFVYFNDAEELLPEQFFQKDPGSKIPEAPWRIVGINFTDYSNVHDLTSVGLRQRASRMNLNASDYKALGGELFEKKKWKEAEAALRKALMLVGTGDISDPDPTSIYFELSDALAKQRRTEEAIRILEQAPKKSDLVYFYYSLGQLYSDKKEWTRVIGYYLLAVQKCKESGQDADTFTALIYAKLGDAYQALGDAQKALEAYQQAFGRDMTYYLRLVELLEKQNNFKAVTEVYEKIFSKDPIAYYDFKAAWESALTKSIGHKKAKERVASFIKENNL